MFVDQTLKEVHGLVVEKTKLGRPSTSERSHWHQDHAKINVCVLGDAMVMQRQNDQKVANHIHAKAQGEWDKIVIIA